MADNNPDEFNLLRKIENKPGQPQREMAKDLGFSLGKLNYCMQALKEKGLIKIKNFKQQIETKLSYVITPKGISETQMTVRFMKLR